MALLSLPPETLDLIFDELPVEDFIRLVSAFNELLDLAELNLRKVNAILKKAEALLKVVLERDLLNDSISELLDVDRSSPGSHTLLL